MGDGPGRTDQRAAARRGAVHRRHRLGDGRDHVRRGHPGADRRLRDRAAGQGRDARRARPGWSRRCSPAVPVDLPGRSRPRRGGRGRHRRRPGPHRQHLHHGRAGGGRRRQYAVVKHGNRAASSSCGAADLLEYLGIPLDLGPTRVRPVRGRGRHRLLFRARFHPGCATPRVTRRELGVPTAFNFLGPLTNPARPRAAAVGCADARMAPVMAEVFAAPRRLGARVRGEDGLDEFTTTGADPALGRSPTARCRAPSSTRPTSASPGAAPGDLRGGRRGFQRQRRPPGAGRRAGPGPRRGAAQRGGRHRRVRRARWRPRRGLGGWGRTGHRGDRLWGGNRHAAALDRGGPGRAYIAGRLANSRRLANSTRVVRERNATTAYERVSFLACRRAPSAAVAA